MAKTRQKKVPLETQLGLLAMQFRGTKDEARRNESAANYAHVVLRLIESGKWKEMPSFEDMLPSERMPEAFFVFWSIPSPHDRARDQRRKPTIILEGQDDVAILRAVLPPRVVDACELRPVGGRPSLIEAAKTQIVTRHAPVAILVDTDTLN